jgi:hypothetical protein
MSQFQQVFCRKFDKVAKSSAQIRAGNRAGEWDISCAIALR